jgi:hypothetical protein
MGSSKFDIDKDTHQQNLQWGRMKRFAWGNIPDERSRFAAVLHMFFSPYQIPSGLTCGQARLIYLIAIHFDGKPFGGSLLPKEWRRKNRNITSQEFFLGLKKFTRDFVATGGLLPASNHFARQLIANQIRPPIGVKVKGEKCQVARFIRVHQQDKV